MCNILFVIVFFSISFRYLFSQINTTTFDYSGFYTIVFTQHCNKNIVEKIFLDCWSLHIANAIVLIPTLDHTKIHLYTYFPYRPHNCEVIEPVIFDIYFENGSFSRNAPIFPNKFRNFFKCPLMISTYTFSPFISVKSISTGLFHLDGIEGRMLVTLAQRLNFTPVIQISLPNIDLDTSQTTLRKSLDMVNVLSKQREKKNPYLRN